ncbi:MAG: 4-demethylwyosine synthase TYW1 [Candidatus Diapherotrites archaeon]|nr:4-demethylwyosine synthase TYW1 [Candidatus Diapherotrites archaeon]
MLELNEKLIKDLEKKQYGVSGHAGVQICTWNKKSLIGKGSCYKQKFYDVHCHKCMQFTPLVLWCQENCIFCWRTMELMKTAKLNKKDVLKPEEFVEELIEKRKKLLSGFPGNPKTDKKLFTDALEPDHYAISLSGEPTLYPYLAELVKYLKEKKKARSVFIVSNGQEPEMIKKLEKEKALPHQLYISLSAPNEKLFKRINASVYTDGWKRLKKTLSMLSKLKCRTVVRLTLIKGKNDSPEFLNEWCELLSLADSDFVEIKSYMHLGYSRKRLSHENMPSWKEVTDFAEKISENTDFKVHNEAENSLIILLKNKKSKKKDFFE